MSLADLDTNTLRVRWRTKVCTPMCLVGRRISRNF